jgi:hypothetical protein
MSEDEFSEEGRLVQLCDAAIDALDDDYVYNYLIVSDRCNFGFLSRMCAAINEEQDDYVIHTDWAKTDCCIVFERDD